MLNRNRNLLTAMVAVLSLVCATIRPARSQEPTTPLTIRLVHGTPTVEIIAMMKAKKDILPNYGKAYTLELREIDPCSEAANVLAAGAADIAVSCTGPLINTNTKLNAHLRIVADADQNGVNGQNAIWYCVTDDSPIKKISDLKGKTVATTAFGTWTDLSMRVGMKKAGFDPADATIVQLPFSAMEPSLREKKVDMVPMVPPFYQIATGKGGIRVLYTAADAQGKVQGLSLMAREDFLAKNPRRVQAFFDDYYRYLQYALN